MVTKFITSYYKNGLWVKLAKGGGYTVGFDIRAKPFRFPEKGVVLLETEVMPVIKQFRISLQNNHRNMHLLISFDILSQYYRNKGSTFSARV
jgi:hypothetical protein